MKTTKIITEQVILSDYLDELWFNAREGGKEGTQLFWWTKDNWKIAVNKYVENALSQYKRELLADIKRTFETMVYEVKVRHTTKEQRDAYIDEILDFRRKQSKYLDKLITESGGDK